MADQPPAGEVPAAGPALKDGTACRGPSSPCRHPGTSRPAATADQLRDMLKDTAGLGGTLGPKGAPGGGLRGAPDVSSQGPALSASALLPPHCTVPLSRLAARGHPSCPAGSSQTAQGQGLRARPAWRRPWQGLSLTGNKGVQGVPECPEPVHARPLQGPCSRGYSCQEGPTHPVYARLGASGLLSDLPVLPKPRGTGSGRTWCGPPPAPSSQPAHRPSGARQDLRQEVPPECVARWK